MSIHTRRLVPQVLIALVLLAVLGGAATGIVRGFRGSSPSSASHPILRWANEKIYDIYTLDPARGLDFNARLAAQMIYSGLVRVGPRVHIMPDAAASWRVSPDGRTYTFKLRPNVRFADGRLLRAQDVAYSLNRTLTPQFAKLSGLYLLGSIDGAAQHAQGKAPSVRGITVPNDRTVRIHLSAPDGSFLAKLATPAGYIVPSWRIRADPKHWDEHAIGTGPFMVSRWVHSTALFLVPNPHYYGGTLQLSGIDMPFIPEPLAAYKRYRSDGVDIMGSVEFPASVLYAVRGRKDFHTSPRLETVFLTLNERVAPFNNIRVRQAFSHAIDKAALVREAYDGFAHPTDALVPPSIPAYRTAVPKQYDPALARKLLAEAGYPGGRGLPAVTFPVDQGSQSVVLASSLASQLRHVLGVRVRAVEYSHSAYLDLLTKLRYQVAVIDWTYDFLDPQNFLSQQLRTGVPNNNGGYSNPRFDLLVDRADHLMGAGAARMALYREAESVAIRDAAVIPLANPDGGILVRSVVHGLQVSGGFLLVKDWTKVRVGGQR